MQNKPQFQPQTPSTRKQTQTHFHTNSIFSGQTRTLQRIGTGLIAYNDNTCAIVSYNENSQFDGRCVFYRERCLISVCFVRNRIVDLVYRVDGYLMFLRYDEQARLDGEGYLVGFVDRTVHKIKYEQGYVREKVKMLTIEKLPIETVFLNEAFHLIIGKVHNRAIRHQITSQDIQNIRMRKIGNKVQVHYMQNAQQKLSQGLGFQFIFRAPENGGYNPQTNIFKDQFTLKITQRGLYKNNMLQGYGMRIFKNNNLYEGHFKQNIFHGEGCLRNVQKGSWVYGVFENGEMRDILDFCNQGSEGVKADFLLDCLRRREGNFLGTMIEENGFLFLDVELERVCGMGDIQELKSENFQDRKQEIMRKITAQFTQLEALNKATLQQQINRLKASQTMLTTVSKLSQSKNPGSQTDRKQKQKQKNRTIKSLMPQAIKANNYFNFAAMKNNQRDLQNMEEEKQNFQKTVEMKLTGAQKKKYGKIFHKNYAHLQEKNDSGDETVKEKDASARKRMRKSAIFTSESPFKSQFSDASLSPGKQNGEQPVDDVYRGRSPDRITTIFPNTVKLKKVVSPNRFDENSEEFLTGKSRKNSIQKRNRNKIKKAANSHIFEQPKQKVMENAGKFVYTYENEQDKNITPMKSEQPTTDKKYSKLKPPSLLLSKSQRT